MRFFKIFIANSICFYFVVVFFVLNLLNFYYQARSSYKKVIFEKTIFGKKITR